MPSLRLSAATGVMWSAAETWIARATTAGAFIVLSRQLLPTEFGLVALAMAVIGVLALFGDSGISTYVVRAQHLDRAVLSTAFWLSVALSVGLVGALALVAGPVSGLFDEPDLAPVVQLLSLGLLLKGLASVPSALLRRSMRFRALAVRGTVATLVGSVVAITMALSGYGVWALVAQDLVRGAVSAVIIGISARWLPALAWSGAGAREMVGFGSKLLTINLLITVRDRGEDFVLAGISGTGVLGLWSVANRLVRILQETGSSVVNSVATPAFSKMQADPQRLFRAYETSLVAAGSLMFPALALLAVISPDLVPTLLGEQWQQAADVAQVVALTSLVGVFVFFDRALFVALDRLRPEMVMVALIVTAHLAIVVLVAPLGLLPLALALLARALVTWPVRMVVLHRVTELPYRVVVRPLRVLLAAAVMAGAVQVALLVAGGSSPWLRIAVGVAVAAVVYPAAMWIVARPVLIELAGDVQRVRLARTALPAVPTEEVRDVPVAR